MTGQMVTENGHVSAVRWGIAVKSPASDTHGVMVCHTEDEARARLIDGERLVMDDGNGWAVVE